MTKIRGDTVEEFIANANRFFKDGGGGRTIPKLSRSSNFKEGKLVKLQFTFSFDMDFAEVGPGHPDELNKAAIAAVAELAKKHEESHRDGYRAAFDKWNDKVPDGLMKQTFKNKKEAEEAIEDQIRVLKGKWMDACLELHKKEGSVEVQHNKQNNKERIDFTVKPAGARGCSF